jgi:hypothetical protein
LADTFTWHGAKGDDWFTASLWSPAGPPSDGSVALIEKDDGPTVNTGDAVVDHVSIVLGSENARLFANGGSFGAGVRLSAAATDTDMTVATASEFDGTFGFATGVKHGSFNIDGTAGQTLTIGQSGALSASSGDGIFLYNGTVTNLGTLAAAGGLVSVYSGELQGDGTVEISKGGELYSNVGIGAGQTIDFLDPTGSLQLYQPGTLGAEITNFQAGDEIILYGVTADKLHYDASSHRLDVTELGSVVASFSLISNGGSLDFQLSSGNDTVITASDATRVWNGGTADWYVAGNWTSTPASPASFPLAGDTVEIGSGLATISADDLLQYGTIDAETIFLNGVSATPGGMALDNDTIGPNATIETTGCKQVGLLEIRGTTTLNGVLDSHSQSGWLTTYLADGATLVNSGQATVLDGTSSGLDFYGTGTFINNGLVVTQGGLTIGPNVTATSTTGNTQQFRMVQGGRITIDGTFQNNAVVFGDTTGYLTIDNLAGFQGQIWDMGGGNRIDLAGLVVNTVSYSAQSDTLTLLDNGGTVGQLTVYTLDGLSGFNVAPDGKGGSLITYTPGMQVLQPGLPVPIVASPGGTESLRDLLIHAFGTIPAGYNDATYGLSYVTPQILADDTFSYWNLNNELVTEWYNDGTLLPGLPEYPYLPPVPPTTVLPGSSLAGITLQAGTAIMPGAILSIPTGGPAANPTESVAYYIATVDPNVASPTIYSGTVDPSDIVASALRFATYYGQVANSDDCGWIADDLAAAAGAPMPMENWSTDPSANQPGGFWRIAYQASEVTNPVQDWGTLVQAGDIVRMGWVGGGQHTTTVLAVNADGSIVVYDNADNGVIGIHDATYWTDTIPDSITIYRLDAGHQYLVQGGTIAEYLQGSPYNNLIEPGGGADTIAGGAGLNVIRDTAADINGISIVDWHQGDSIDLTDMKFAGASVAYDPTSGVLDIKNPGAQQDVLVNLPTGLPNAFQLTPAAGGDATLVTLACFAGGTRLRTPTGDVAVEALAVGDRLVTVCDAAVASREIRWIGRRTVDPRRHPRPDAVRPVRIAAHAFGRGRPGRALLLSPDHALFVEGVLIPVRYLIDGKRIVQVSPATVTYWHVELDAHDAVLAEGLAAESYLDTGQRSAFENGGKTVMLHPDFSGLVWEAAGCAELVVTGPKLAAVRALLATQPRPPGRRLLAHSG